MEKGLTCCRRGLELKLMGRKKRKRSNTGATLSPGRNGSAGVSPQAKRKQAHSRGKRSSGHPEANLDNMPSDILCVVFSFLEPNHLGCLCGTSKYLLSIADTQPIWGADLSDNTLTLVKGWSKYLQTIPNLRQLCFYRFPGTHQLFAALYDSTSWNAPKTPTQLLMEWNSRPIYNHLPKTPSFTFHSSSDKLSNSGKGPLFWCQVTLYGRKGFSGQCQSFTPHAPSRTKLEAKHKASLLAVLAVSTFPGECAITSSQSANKRGKSGNPPLCISHLVPAALQTSAVVALEEGGSAGKGVEGYTAEKKRKKAPRWKAEPLTNSRQDALLRIMGYKS